MSYSCEKSIFKNWPCSFVRLFMDLGVISVHRHSKKELGQYQVIMTTHSVNNPHNMCYYALLSCELEGFSRFSLTLSESCQVCQNDNPGPIRLMADLCVYGLFTVYCTSCWNSKGKIWFIRSYFIIFLTHSSIRWACNIACYWENN